MASLYLPKYFQFHDDSGDPLNAGTLTFYATTTTTPKNAFPTEADAIAGTNAFTTRTLDADGRCPTAVWLSGRYRLIVKNSAGTTISDDDPVEDAAPGSSTQGSTTSYGGNNSGTSNALIFTYSPAISAYTNGATLRGRVTSDNTGAVTINAGAGAKSLVKRDGAALVAGDLQSPEIIEFTYDSTADVFRLQSGGHMEPQGHLVAVRTYTSSDTWTKPGHLDFVIVEVQAGGGGGGGSDVDATNSSASGGGGGGGYARKKIAAASLGSTETVTVGAAGAGGAAGANNGTAGGTSSFGAHASATGGGGGLTGTSASTANSAYATGASGGVGSSGDINVDGETTTGSLRHSATGINIGSKGGDSYFGKGGRAGMVGAGNTILPSAGTGYGAGGGGAAEMAAGIDRAGGNGTAGIVIVYEYA